MRTPETAAVQTDLRALKVINRVNMLIESFHSGPRGHRRYCSLHRPGTRLVKSTGIVLCNPLGHEYYRAYRAYVKLAHTLAQTGFPVLRFDYVGTGDSEGDASHARLDDWIGDIVDSVHDLRESEDVTDVVLGGIRFGGTLAVLAAERLAEARGVILWESVNEGEDYLAQLRALHKDVLADLERFATPRSAADCMPTELVGTAYARSFLDDISGVSVSPGENSLLQIFTPREDSTAAGGQGQRSDYGWNDRSRIEESIVDPGVIKSLVSNLNTALA